MKKRFILLNIVILLVLSATVIYVGIVGDDYTMGTRCFVTEDKDQVDVVMKCDKDGVIEITGITFEEDRLMVKLHSVGHGSVNASFTINGGAYMDYDARFYVNRMGTIIEQGNNNYNFSGYEMAFWGFMFILLLVIVIDACSFFECRKKNLFSYKMISYGGVVMFCTVLFAFLLYKQCNNMIRSFPDIILHIARIGDYFVMGLAPFMMVLAIALSVSNVRLMRREGYRPVNALGIFISLLWILALMLSLDFGVFEMIRLPYVPFVRATRDIVTYVSAYFESMLISTVVCAYMASRHTPPYDRDFVIILGCAIRPDGSLTPLLRSRVDSALSFEKEQFKRTDKHACFVPSGGQGADEVISEAEAMERYLLEQGVPQERILREDRSVNTYENMRFSRQVIEGSGGDVEKIAFATTNYHVFRGYILSEKNGFRAQGISARTKWYFFPNAFIREFIGLLYDRKFHHLLYVAAILALVIGFYIIGVL